MLIVYNTYLSVYFFESQYLISNTFEKFNMSSYLNLKKTNYVNK